MNSATQTTAGSAAQVDQEKPRVGLLGVGLMGSAMARRLLEQGIAVIAWDLDPDHVRALEARGFKTASNDHADEDLAAIYELDRAADS
jgi:3-hydroxyisobutyrate dehydrogenase-like beta-hydroxyacid dehydrogenase